MLFWNLLKLRLHHETDNGCQFIAKIVTVPAPSPRDSTNEVTLAPSPKEDEDKYETTPSPSSDEEDKTMSLL